MTLLLPTGTRYISRVKKAINTGADQVWPTDLHMRKGTYMDARHPSQPLVTQWVLGTSSHTIFSCWKEIFPNEDATWFDLVDELYTLPAKLPTSMFQFAAWLEDWMTKLAVADEVAACIKPRRAMAVLMNIGKPLQTSDNIFMTERVAIFCESGLR